MMNDKHYSKPLDIQKCTVAMLKCNNPNVEKDCLYSIINNTEYPYDLIVRDNWIERKHVTVQWNELVKQSHNDYVCLINSDCIVTSGWLKGMMEVITASDKIAAVGPSTDNCRGPQSQEQRSGIVDFEEYGERVQMCGFCFVLSKKVWLRLNGFDEDFRLYGNETEFFYRARQAGYRTLWVSDIFVKHLGCQTISKFGFYDVESERNYGRQKYKELRDK